MLLPIEMLNLPSYSRYNPYPGSIQQVLYLKSKNP
jgi:hypothetical protein